MRRDAKRGFRGAWVTEAVLDAGGKMERGKMPTHLRCHRHYAEDENALAETSVSAAGFSSPRLPVRRSCMGLLRAENDSLNFFFLVDITPAIPETGVSLWKRGGEKGQTHCSRRWRS
jgi:hypothetical protein